MMMNCNGNKVRVNNHQTLIRRPLAAVRGRGREEGMGKRRKGGGRGGKGEVLAPCFRLLSWSQSASKSQINILLLLLFSSCYDESKIIINDVAACVK